eukprot:3123700-Rhodomonas_salina.1
MKTENEAARAFRWVLGEDWTMQPAPVEGKEDTVDETESCEVIQEEDAPWGETSWVGTKKVEHGRRRIRFNIEDRICSITATATVAER